jgi:hypothetical protein
MIIHIMMSIAGVGGLLKKNLRLYRFVQCSVFNKEFQKALPMGDLKGPGHEKIFQQF